MHRTVAHASALALIGSLAACSSPRPPLNTETIVKTDIARPLEGHPVLSMPIHIPDSKSVLVALTMTDEKGLFESDDPYNRGGIMRSSYSRRVPAASVAPTPASESYSRPERRYPPSAWNAPAEVRWHNAIVRTEDGSEHLILERRGVIGRWQSFGTYDPNVPAVKPRGLVFIAVLDDTNKDKALNNLDARVAIVTDAHGRHPRAITPADAQVWQAIYNLELDTLFLEVVRDTNSDRSFGFDDDPVPYEWKVGSDAPATPIVSRSTLDRALQLLK